MVVVVGGVCGSVGTTNNVRSRCVLRHDAARSAQCTSTHSRAPASASHRQATPACLHARGGARRQVRRIYCWLLALRSPLPPRPRSAHPRRMGLLTILKKIKRKEREMRVLILCVGRRRGGCGAVGRLWKAHFLTTRPPFPPPLQRPRQCGQDDDPQEVQWRGHRVHLADTGLCDPDARVPRLHAQRVGRGRPAHDPLLLAQLL